MGILLQIVPLCCFAWCAQVRYLGYGSKNDEWIARKAPRIQPYNTRSRSFRGPTAEAVVSDQELVFEDGDDPAEVLMCQRKWHRISEHLLSLASQVLGHSKGLAVFVGRMQRTDPPMPFVVRPPSVSPCACLCVCLSVCACACAFGIVCPCLS